MNRNFYIPKWIRKHRLRPSTDFQIPENQLGPLNQRLEQKQSDLPVVSVVIPAWNEEKHLLQLVSSLSRQKTRWPFEILIVDNNSTDHTPVLLQQLAVRSVFQEKQGHGHARQKGLEMAKGTYILTGDADTIYPANWIETMMEGLTKPGVSCVYGSYSFLPEQGKENRFQLAFYEMARDFLVVYRMWTAPFWNVLGMNMGFRKADALAIGFDERAPRGEDGLMAIQLMKRGKLKYVRSQKARCWTTLRTLRKDGSLGEAFWTRVAKQLNLIPQVSPEWQKKNVLQQQLKQP